ncbi:hypothetical protein WKK05_40560 (plasmid) [Nostoc sp. UHCC 0302]|uniref:hypothetical protein n=1 Tax=Nostoc sp. UHCC 0302 TaxID=3134896 RepID=UPI00311CA1EB
MQLLEKKQINLTPIFLMGNAVLLLLLLLIQVVNFARIGKVAQSKMPTLVELADGSSIRVSPIDNEERTAAAITYFVGQTMTGLLSWTGIPNSNDSSNPDPTKKPVLDAGVQVGDKKITTNVWVSGFALSEDFRGNFLEELGSLTPVDVFNGTTQSVLAVRDFSEPQKLAQGKWSIDMVANLVVFQGSNQVGRAIAFNKTIFVRAIDTPPPPPNSSKIQRIAYGVRKSGLEIYKMQDLELGK